jgi:hypothetical protein
MGDPDGIAIDVYYGHEEEVADALLLQRPRDHEMTLTCCKGVLSGVGVLGAADADDDVIAVPGDGLDHLEMTLVEWLEPANEQTVSVLGLHLIEDRWRGG